MSRARIGKVSAVANQRRRLLARPLKWPLVVVAVVVGLVVSPPAAADSSEEDLVALLEAEFDRSALPGLAVTVTRGDEVLHLGGYGEAADGQPMTADTPVRVGSLSKSFTAAAVLQLVERGEIELDNPVQHYLGTFTTGDDTHASQVTVLHLLHQTSGLADRGFPQLWDLDQSSAGERVATLASAVPVGPPGAAHHYFNPNYEILAHLVEVVTETPYDTYLRERVLRPLGMAATSSVTRVEQAASVHPDLAQGHLVIFGRPVVYDEPDGFAAGSAGVVTTAADLSRWLRFHIDPGHADTGDVLGSELVALAHTPPAGPSEYAMGWYTNTLAGTPVVQHDGILATSYAMQILVPETGHGVALLANANHAFTDVPRITENLVAQLAGSEPPPAPMTHRRLVWLFAAVIAAGVTVRTFGVRRRHRWVASWHASSRRRLDRVRRVIGLARLAVPMVALVGLPTFVALASGRVFPRRLMALTAPELVTWLAIASTTALILAAARWRALRRNRDHDPATAAPTTPHDPGAGT